MNASRTRRASKAGLVLCVLLGVLFGLGAYTAKYAEATSYLSDDPTSCINCHVMREHYDAWAKSQHHAVANCNDCHVPASTVPRYATKALHGWRHSKAFTLQNFHEPIQITPEDLRIVEVNCVRCHSEVASHMSALPGPRGVESTNCTHCHASAGHGPIR